MKREMNTLLKDYEKKYSHKAHNHGCHIKASELCQIFDIAKTKGKTEGERIIQAVCIAWEAGYMAGAKK